MHSHNEVAVGTKCVDVDATPVQCAIGSDYKAMGEWPTSANDAVSSECEGL